MKNNQIYLNFDEQIAAFNKYCDSQPSCPCKFGCEHCELKWLQEEAEPMSVDVDYREKILEILKKNNWYTEVWNGALVIRFNDELTFKYMFDELTKHPTDKEKNT